MAVAGLVPFLASTQASAQTAATPNCDVDTTVLGDAGTVDTADLVDGVCVETTAKLWGNFDFSANMLTAGATVTFNTQTVGDTVFHQISFNSAYNIGETYTIGYDVEVTDAEQYITRLSADFTQNDTNQATDSRLTKATDPDGDALIDFFKDGPLVTSGNTVSNYFPGVTTLRVDETLINNGVISSVTNTVVENPIPEPGSLALLGLGLAGLGFLRRRKLR
jgi:PEP-CTERM motif